MTDACGHQVVAREPADGAGVIAQGSKGGMRH